jgi:nucleotide-binding universal stress UspA family protein
MDTKNHSTGGLPQISRILVATDFSHQSGRALEWARSLADAVGAKLALLHVIDIFSLAETGCLPSLPTPV